LPSNLIGPSLSFRSSIKGFRFAIRIVAINIDRVTTNLLAPATDLIGVKYIVIFQRIGS
jgi:hypothetical protein